MNLQCPLLPFAVLSLVLSGCEGSAEPVAADTSVEVVDVAVHDQDLESIEWVETPWWGTPENLDEAQAIWAQMSGENFASTWTLMPGTTRNLLSNAPHGGVVNVYLNDAAAVDPSHLAAGSIVVKASMSTPGAPAHRYSVIKKIPDFDPEHQDWFWVEYDDIGHVVTDDRGTPLAGAIGPNKTSDCVSCHKFDSDFVFLNPTQ
ncbi:MAG: hypothetical protein CO108_24160 [Deltaproteobacteria bacterium CG_4_9_14_3_um_filter_63_12]|nr:MAG: hypothetical protein COW42_08985 [Deltaproteobacteria bacterium CG17_big_fil_post_rev_8_21_14_2_50_63_7]PJB36071.1 MAG: hypothetical protein CO108_24160 [Deltaproteobacteria bacterium CG_4_9_14_3_um_filter_63_12]